MAHVFRRAWTTWRRDKPKSTFVLPPTPSSLLAPDAVARGQRRVVTIGWGGQKNSVFRRPWGQWGGARYSGIQLRTSTAEVTDRNTDKWWMQASEPVRFPRALPAALHPFFGLTQAATQNTLSFGEEIRASSHYQPLSQPIQQKRGFGWMLAGQQLATTWPLYTEINLGWFVALSEPARFLPALKPIHMVPYWHATASDIHIGWFQALSIPPGIYLKPSLPVGLQLHYVHDVSPVPSRPWAQGYIIL